MAATNEPILDDADREAWADWQDACAAHARTQRYRRQVDSARRVLDQVLAAGHRTCVSWSGGKDSTVLTHLALVLHGAPWDVASEKDDLDYPGEEQYVLQLAEQWGVRERLTILRPPISPREYYAQAVREIGAGADVHGRAAGLSKTCFYNVMAAHDRLYECVLMGLRTEESGTRERLRESRGRYYWHKGSRQWRAIPIADWQAIDVYAYALAHGIELLPVYRCVGFAHAREPWLLRKSWWVPGTHSATGGVAWLRRYYPSLYRTLCSWSPEASHLA